MKSQEVDELFKFVESNPNAQLDADLQSQTVSANGKTYSFAISPFNKECLLKGLDGIGWTMQFEDKIKDYESKLMTLKPWLK